MEVTVHLSRNPRQIRQYGGYLGEVEVVETDGNILQRLQVVIIGIHLQSRTVGSTQV